nr:MAG TPA: hypothetical protein [Caudoviricetes sp.]
MKEQQELKYLTPRDSKNKGFLKLMGISLPTEVKVQTNSLKSVGSMVITRKEVRFFLLINFRVVVSKHQISGILRKINN